MEKFSGFAPQSGELSQAHCRCVKSTMSKLRIKSDPRQRTKISVQVRYPILVRLF